MTAVRDELAARIGRPERKEPEADTRIAELERRRQALAPEAVAGDVDALAELDAIEGEIADIERERELADLAAREQAERDRLAAEEEKEQQRAAWTDEKAQLEQRRDSHLAGIERALGKLVDEIAQLRDDEIAIAVVGRSLDPDWNPPRTMAVVEDRIGRRLREVAVQADGLLYGTAGMEPLAAPKSVPRARARAREKGAE